MPLVCDHCDAEFDPEGSDGRRCPKCLRRQGVRQSAKSMPATTATSGGVLAHAWLLILLIATVSAVGYLAVKGPAAMRVNRKGGRAVDTEGNRTKGKTLSTKGKPAPGGAKGSVQRAREALAGGDLKEAYRQADAAVKASPKNAAAREVMGDVLLQSGAQAEASKEYAAAIAIEPTGTRLVKQGNLMLARGDEVAASELLKRALEKEPGASWAVEARKALAEMGEAEGAVLSAEQGADSVAPDGKGPAAGAARGGGPP